LTAWVKYPKNDLDFPDMKLQAKTRYGVRAVFDLAYHNVGGATQARDVARREGIPLRYLEQIFQDLKKAGIVDSRRGPRGGYILRRPPETIRLGDVVRALQGPLEDIFAPDDVEKKADLKKHGGAQVVTAGLWRELGRHVAGWFDAVSLSDLVKRGADLGLPRGERKPPMYFI
jgi:Rrf2 family transcriptional regulator, iron-sulfur cluster assembly transcription factor